MQLLLSPRKLILLSPTVIMDKETHCKLYGDLEKVIQYMDYGANPVPDNLHYIPDLVPGVLQPLEVIEDDPEFDNLLQNLDVEAIMQKQRNPLLSMKPQSRRIIIISQTLVTVTNLEISPKGSTCHQPE